MYVLVKVVPLPTFLELILQSMSYAWPQCTGSGRQFGHHGIVVYCVVPLSRRRLWPQQSSADNKAAVGASVANPETSRKSVLGGAWVSMSPAGRRVTRLDKSIPVSKRVSVLCVFLFCLSVFFLTLMLLHDLLEDRMIDVCIVCCCCCCCCC